MNWTQRPVVCILNVFTAETGFSIKLQIRYEDRLGRGFKKSSHIHGGSYMYMVTSFYIIFLCFHVLCSSQKVLACRDDILSSCVEPVLSSGYMSCSWTHHCDLLGDESQTSNPSTYQYSSATRYQLCHCAPQIRTMNMVCGSFQVCSHDPRPELLYLLLETPERAV